MSFTGRAATVASRDAGVKPTRMYLRRVAAWPGEFMSSNRTFRLRSFRNLVMVMNPAIVIWDSNRLTGPFSAIGIKADQNCMIYGIDCSLGNCFSAEYDIDCSNQWIAGLHHIKIRVTSVLKESSGDCNHNRGIQAQCQCTNSNQEKDCLH